MEKCSPIHRERTVQSPIVLHQRFFKMVLDNSLPNTQNYKALIKGKVEWYPPFQLGVVAIQKKAFVGTLD